MNSTNGVSYEYSVSVFIAAGQTPTTHGDSSAGHMWIALENYTNGYNVDYYGFASGNGLPYGPGKIVINDNEAYKYSAYTIKFPLTKEQYTAINDFVYNTDHQKGHSRVFGETTFGGYDVVQNSCVDFTFSALRAAGIGAERGYITQDGRMIPMWNIPGLEEIHQTFLNNQGYPGETKYWEHGTGGGTELDSEAVAIRIRDINQLKSFVGSHVQAPLNSDQIAQLAICIHADLENHTRVALPPEMEQQVKQLTQQYRQDFPERVLTAKNGDTHDRGVQEPTVKIDEIRNTALAVSDLPRNPHSKVLFDAYAKEALNKGDGCWTAEINKTIAENMLKDGIRPQRVEQALKHSPEPVENPYYFVKDIKNSPDLQVAQQSRGRGIC